ncbi:MAG: tetratricopeptide repeat protein [Cyanobacteria bacterium P01_D01_bin.156]
MLTRQITGSTDELYRDARIRWSKAVKCGIYDNEDMICRVIVLLEKAREQNPGHVKVLVLLSDLLMELGVTEAAIDVVNSLLSLEPSNRTHLHKKQLLQQMRSSPNSDNHEAMRDFVEARWTRTNDW